MQLNSFGVGVVVADAEFKSFENGGGVGSVNLAFNRSFKDREGAWQKETSYVKAQIFGPKAEKFVQFAKKGTPIFVEGYLKQESWQTKEGDKRTTLVLNLNNFEIVQKTNGENKAEKPVAASPPKNKKSTPKPEPVAVAASQVEDNDEIPF